MHSLKFAPALAALLSLACALMAPLAHAADKPTVYGKNLLQSIDLPIQVVAEFNNAAAAAKPGAPSGVFETLKDWKGAEFDAPTKGNPYVMVVKVSGLAVADGNVLTRWQPSWALDSGDARSTLMTGLLKDGVKAGERVNLIGSSAPMSFKDDRKIAPALGLQLANNVRIDSVQIEVWSGLGSSSFTSKLFAWSPLLVGLVFLGLFFWFRRG